jgi:hydroxypyruvate reductase/glycerate 2-kinase
MGTCTAQDLAHIDRIDALLVRADAACTAAAAAAREHGFEPMLLSTLFEGESSQLARYFGAIARQILMDGNPLPRPCVLIGGGETTVTINGPYGTGGPNQEFAMRLALDLNGVEGVVALGIDTDGTDGPTPYAGALVDGSSAASLRDLGVDVLRSLRLHDVTQPLRRSGHIIETGATNTNVNDLKLVLIS